MARAIRSAIVTGAACGIGRAACERLAADGWRVLAVDRDAAALAWAATADGVEPHVADISLEADNAGMVAAAEAAFGAGVDAVLLNAGIDASGAIDELPLDAVRRLIDVNLMGPLLGIRAALPALRRAGGGAILLTTSTLGIGGDAGNWAYSATKHGLVGLTYSLARELGHEGIRVNAIAPGLTRATGLTRQVEEHAPDAYAAVARMCPLQRWAEPAEMAAVMAFMVSAGASYLNGTVVPVDGGAIVGVGLQPPAGGTAFLGG